MENVEAWPSEYTYKILLYLRLNYFRKGGGKILRARKLGTLLIVYLSNTEDKSIKSDHTNLG